MKLKSPIVFLLTMLMILQCSLFGGAAFAAGSNLPNITQYGLYSYVDSNDTLPTAIQVKYTGNDGSTYTSWPWEALTQIPYVFESNTGIGIVFATNVATPTYWDQNATKLKMYNSSGGQVAASVIRLGDGTSSDANRNYIFVIPEEALQPSSTYKIVVDADLTSNNGQEAGKIQQVDFTTAADSTRPSWSSGSLTASGIADTSLTLTWTAGAQDDVAVTGYKILKNGTEIGTVSGGGNLSYSVTGLTPGTSYSFQVQARDAAGNSSTNGPATSATTGAATDSTSVSLSLNKTAAPPGGSITVSGTAAPSRWVSIQALDGSNNIVFFNAVKSNASGSYSDTFKVPAVSAGSYTVLAGYGSNVASAGLNVIPEVTSDVSISGDGSNKHLALTANTPASVAVTVPQGVSDASLNVAELLSSNAGGISTSALPTLNISSIVTLNSSPVEVTVVIPAGTVVSAASDWDGTINMPTVQAVDSVTVTPNSGKTATVKAVIEVGCGDIALEFSQAVKLVIPGQAGQYAGYCRGGSFTPITTALTATSQAEVDAELLAKGVQDGKQNSGSDLVIWTKHFTSFVTYTQSSSGSESSNEGAPSWPSGSTLTGTKADQVVTLTWTAATDSTGVTGYKIYMDDGTEVASVDGSTLTCQIPNVNGQRSFKVEAGNSAGYWTTDGPSSGTVGGGGNNPLNYVSSNLTTISGSTSSDGDSVDGSSNVPVNPVIRIVFDRNVTTDALWPANQQCFTMKNSSGASASINVTKISNADNFEERRNVFITPDSSLTAGKTYTITISGSLEANNGNTLGSDQTITFTVAGGGSSAITTSGPTVTTGTASVDPEVGATVGQGDYAQVVIPANAIKGSSSVTVKVEKVDAPAAPTDAQAISDVYEFTIDNQKTYSFATKVAITLSFAPDLIAEGEVAALFYYDETQDQWVMLGGEVVDDSITVQVDHFTKFAVFAVKQSAVPVVPAVTQAKVNLKDIQNHWAKAAIEKLLLLGAVSGYPDGTFKPDAKISRAEFVTMLVKAFNLTGGSDQAFEDTARHWAKDYIATAAASGIVSGYSEQAFGPDDPITREQMAVMVVKAAKLAPAAGEQSFVDSSSISAWAKEAVITAVKNGIMNGYPDNTIRPGNEASRGEAASLIANALK